MTRAAAPRLLRMTYSRTTAVRLNYKLVCRSVVLARLPCTVSNLSWHVFSTYYSRSYRRANARVPHPHHRHKFESQRRNRSKNTEAYTITASATRSRAGCSGRGVRPNYAEGSCRKRAHGVVILVLPGALSLGGG